MQAEIPTPYTGGAARPYPFRLRETAAGEPRPTDRCAASRCESASGIIHLGTPLCDRHWGLAAAEPESRQ